MVHSDGSKRLSGKGLGIGDLQSVSNANKTNKNRLRFRTDYRPLPTKSRLFEHCKGGQLG
jgi:hypothetical protein